VTGQAPTAVAVTGLSSEGLVRDSNEDSLVIGPWVLPATVTETPQTLVFPLGSPLVVAVADGLGGHPGGEVASALAVAELARAGPGLTGDRELRAAVDAANRAVYDAAGRERGLTAMGSTVAGVVVTEDTVRVFNVGDSRVYGVNADGLVQLSVDDSPPLAPGQRTTYIVTQTLGGHPDYVPVQAHVREVPVSAYATLLVCSDGLSDMLTVEEMGRLLAEHEDGRAAYELWKAAIEAGGHDNITLALVRFGRR
jgi:PPM family protein phosphatase